MPTSTFFRLPEEKRQRLIDAAWEEFTRTSFADASINWIIHEARIPRGSFYQYFADKEDLFWHLLSGVQEHISNVFHKTLNETGGDLFSVTVRVFDKFLGAGDQMDPGLKRIVQVAQLNQGMDFQRFLFEEFEALPAWLLEESDRMEFRQRDEAFLHNVFFLTMAALAFSIIETMRRPERWEQYRETLRQKIEIIKCGSLTPAAIQAYSNKEVTKC